LGEEDDGPERDVGEATMQRERGAIADAGVRRLRYDAALLSPDENAHRLARLLVADVLLYAGETAQRWMAAGARPRDLPDQLSEDLREARRLFNAEVPETVRARADYVGDALRLAVRKSTGEALGVTQPLTPIDD
jgi:hypothetical protein